MITVNAEGDGLDSNGSLTITGGNTVVYGPTMGGNGSLDSDGTISVTGGTVVSFGPGSMEQTPGTEGQGWVLVGAQFAAGTSGELVDESGVTVAEFTSVKAATTIIVSSSDIEMGVSCVVVVNGETVGTAVAGEGGVGGMGMGGGPDGGQPGGFDGQPGDEQGTPPEGFAPQG